MAPALAASSGSSPAAPMQQEQQHSPAQGRLSIGHWEITLKIHNSQIAHCLNVGQLVVSFSFLTQLCRLWDVLMWDFLCSCLLIPVQAVKAAPLGTHYNCPSAAVTSGAAGTSCLLGFWQEGSAKAGCRNKQCQPS